MKAFAATTLLLASASAFAPTISSNHRVIGAPPSSSVALGMVDLANGAMSFDMVCREWRCKYDGEAETSKSLESIVNLLNQYLPEVKKASKDAKVNRLVCGGCLDFKLQTTVPLEDFGPWEESGFPPEKEFLEKLKAIDGVSQVETQTITKMEI